MDLDEVTGAIVDAAVRLHIRIGPGLLETVYTSLLSQELGARGLRVKRHHPVHFEIDGLVFDQTLRLDLLVEDAVVVELKSVEMLLPVHKKHVLTYLRLMDLRVGLLLNFGAPTMKEGLHRIVNNYSSASPRLCVMKLKS